MTTKIDLTSVATGLPGTEAPSFPKPGGIAAAATGVLASLPPEAILLQSQVRWIDIERLGHSGDCIEDGDYGALFAALHTLGHRLVLFIRGEPRGVCIGLGIVVEPDLRGRLDPSQSIDALERLLYARFPGTVARRRFWNDLKTHLSFNRYSHFGALVGQPEVAERAERTLRSPIGDLLQALPDRDLAVVIIADPLDGAALDDEIAQTTRDLQSAVGAASVESQETEQLTLSLRRTEGVGVDHTVSKQETRSEDRTKTSSVNYGAEASISASASYNLSPVKVTGSVSAKVSRTSGRSESESLGRSLMKGYSARAHEDVSNEHATSRTRMKTTRRELRDVQASLAAELLETERRRLLRGLSGGAWQVAVHVGAADATTLHAAGATLIGSLSGSPSLQRPLRFAALPQDQVPRAVEYLGSLHPWRLEGETTDRFRTLMNNAELGEVGALPMASIPGFEVRRSVEFGQTVHTSASASIDLGSLHAFGRTLKSRRVDIDLDSLTMHTLVSGTTGSGKSTTVIHLLDRVWREHRVPFLVVDPKEEYAEALRSRFSDLRVLGPTDTALRLNPFQVVGGRSVALHAEQLRDLFCASFDTEAAMPELILQAMLEVYRRRGWDLRRNRFTGPGTPKYPTLTDLQNEIRRTVARNGFTATLESNYRAAIGSRIRALRTGWKGDLLDGAESPSSADLFEHPTVLDVGQMDAAGRAFLMGLLILRLNALRRSTSDRSGSLRHLLVLEEAHHLLRSPASMGTGGGGSRGHALESMANAIAELRAFGQGIVIADQSPQELHPSVLRGTNLKIIHRLLEGRDQEAIAESLGLDDAQRRALGTLPRGRAVVRAATWESAVAVDVEPVEVPATDVRQLPRRPTT